MGSLMIEKHGKDTEVERRIRRQARGDHHLKRPKIMLTLTDASDSANVTCELRLSPELLPTSLLWLEEWGERSLGSRDWYDGWMGYEVG